MDTKNYVISVKLGLHVNFEFRALLFSNEDANAKTFIRINEERKTVPDLGTIVINMDKKKIGFLYDCFEVMFDVFTIKEINGNYHFKCAADFGRSDIFICEEEIWNEKGDDLFFG